jgi:hypothetical protein
MDSIIIHHMQYELYDWRNRPPAPRFRSTICACSGQWYSTSCLLAVSSRGNSCAAFTSHVISCTHFACFTWLAPAMSSMRTSSRFWFINYCVHAKLCVAFVFIDGTASASFASGSCASHWPGMLGCCSVLQAKAARAARAGPPPRFHSLIRSW